MVAISLLFFSIPIHICFAMPYEDFMPENLNNLSCILLFIDLGISINTGYYDKGQQVIHRWSIVKNYVRKKLITEIFGCFSLIVNYKSANLSEKWINNLILMLYFLKINHFSDITKRIEQRFLLGPRVVNIISLFKLLLTVLLISHIYTCIWIFTA